MTTLAEHAVSGAQLHVLAIGVGHYPYCGSAVRDDEDDTGREIVELTSAPAGALAVADWFTDLAERDARRGPGLVPVPVASVELAVSADGPVVRGGKEVERATFDGVAAAFDRWHRRCSNPDAIALFYYCGHGLAVDWTQQVLLLEDFNEVPHRRFAGAVDFQRTYEGMANSPARSQVYLLDTCRTRWRGTGPAARTDARALAEPRSDRKPPPRTSAPVIHATGFGAAAFGPPGRPSHFAEALCDAVGGLAADNRSADGVWRVHVDDLGGRVRELVDWRLQGDDQPRQEVTVTGQSGGGGVLRVPEVLPPVPFQLGSAPPEAVDTAVLTLTDSATGLTTARRERAPGHWRGYASPAVYDLHATFPDGDWTDGSAKAYCIPPVCHGEVRVSPR
ncbi:caspase family protein [Kitasatospora sp. NPDC004289]